MHLPNLIIDLALILIVAGITTILFKKIRQPLVLGYIVAGFLISPFFPILPTVVDTNSIHIWSEIGIICLMFALGLEFSFSKLINVGGTAIITSVTEVSGMFLLGFLAGRLLGWNNADSVLLGGMLSMSSTTIIIKAFEELDMMKEKFTKIVFGALIVEDIVGIFLMVFMSTAALGTGGSGWELASTIRRLVLYLVILLALGIFVIPTLLKNARELMNDETMMIVSLGICFGMVLLFSYVGFSTALGSFVAGSILAGTIFAEKIEHLVKPIKDLFGAVFFISVGMLVDPAVLENFAVPIVVITVTTIIGKLIFSSLGVLFAGQNLDTAVRSGSSLAQIGEFAFIIAALGTSLGLTSDFLYPVVVSVSVITTFTTPFLIKNSDNLYLLIKKAVPGKFLEKLDSRASDDRIEEEKDQHWRMFLKKYFIDMAVRFTICFGILQVGMYIAEPFVERFMPRFEGQLLTLSIVTLLMAPFLASLLYQRDKNFSILIIKNKSNRIILYAFVALRVVLTASMIIYTINRFLGFSVLWLILPTFIFVILISRSDWIIGKYIEIETRFLANFNEKNLHETERATPDETSGPGHDWISEQLLVSEYIIGGCCKEIGLEIKNLGWGQKYRVNIVKIISEEKHINTPDGGYKIRPNDRIFLLGAPDQTDVFEIAVTKMHENIERQSRVTLAEFIEREENERIENKLFCYAVPVEPWQDFEGKNLRDSKLRAELHGNLIGVKRGGYQIINPDVQFIIKSGDEIWLLGGYKMVSRLITGAYITAEKNILGDLL